MILPPLAGGLCRRGGTRPDGEATAEVPPEPYALQARHFSEVRVLHREVRVIFRGADKFNNLIGSVIYPVGDQPTDLALELVKVGLAKVRCLASLRKCHTSNFCFPPPKVSPQGFSRWRQVPQLLHDVNTQGVMDRMASMCEVLEFAGFRGRKGREDIRHIGGRRWASVVQNFVLLEEKAELQDL